MTRLFEVSERALWIKLVQRHRYELELARISLRGVTYFDWDWNINPWHPHYWNYLWFVFRTKLLNLTVGEDSQYALYHTVTLHTPIIYEMQNNPGFFDTFYPELKIYLRHSDLFPDDNEEMDEFIMPVHAVAEDARIETFKQAALFALLHLADGYSFMHKQEYQRKFCQVQWWNVEVIKLETFLVKRKSKTHWTTDDREPPSTMWQFRKKYEKGRYDKKAIGEGFQMNDAINNIREGKSTKKMLESFYGSGCTATFEDEPDTRAPPAMNVFGLPTDPNDLMLENLPTDFFQGPRPHQCGIDQCPDGHPAFATFDELLAHYEHSHPRKADSDDSIDLL